MATPSRFNRGGFLPPMPGMLPNQAPLAPDPMVPPVSNIAQSPMNRGYAPGSLAGRGPTPVGRGIDDPARQSERLNRIARQQFGQTGDPSLMLSMNWRNRMGPAPAPTPAFTPPLPMAPAAAAPTGRLVPGISAGSMVWQPDATALPVPMMAEEPPPTFGPVPSAPTAPPPLEFGAPAAQFVPSALFPPMGQDYGTGLPPSVLSTQGSGMIGLPQVAPVDPKNPRPLIPTPQQVRQFGLQPDFSKPQEYNGKQYPTFRTPKAEESQRWQLYDAPGPMVPHPYLKDQMIPGPPIKRQVDPITGETRDLVEEGTARAKPGATPQATPTGEAQAPGWLDWLKQKTTKQS